MTRILFVIVILAMAILASENEAILDKRVAEFTFHGRNHKGEIAHLVTTGPSGIGHALRNLAAHTGAPIAIELMPEGVAGQVVPIEIEARNRTIREILAEMVRQDPGYIFRERLGIIEVLPREADAHPADCLNMIIPAFQINERWTEAFQSLQCQIKRVADGKELLPDPIRAGVCPAGSFAILPVPPPGFIQMYFDNLRVRDILDKLSAKVGNIAWEASYQGRVASCESLNLNPYQPVEWRPSEDATPTTWVQGLPAGCTNCHYHRFSR